MNSKEKICPFCEGIFCITKIKEHIGIEHLGYQSKDFIEEKEVSQFQCEVCSTQFISEISLQRHVKFSHSKVEKCSEKTIDKEDSIVKSNHKLGIGNHEQKKNKRNRKGGRLNCLKCSKTFTEGHNLRSHIRIIHEGIRLDCPKCEKSFAHKRNLQLHMRIVHAGILLNCPKCSKTFTQEHNLRTHMMIVHEGIKQSSFDCPKCTKTFTQKHSLQTHMRVTHDGIKLNCTKCEKSFSHKHHLRTHMKTKH